MRRLVCSLAVAAVVAITAGACEPARDPVRVSLGKRGWVVSEGAAAVVRVRARCEQGLEVLEAFVTLSQEDVSSDMTGFPLVCDGTRQRFRVRVPTLDDTRYSPGEAQASAFVLTQEPDSGETKQAQDSEVVVLT
jgi:hypothetical protein